MKLFHGSSDGTDAATPQVPQKLTRRSSGLGELARLWDSKTPLCVLDLGSTSPNNIHFFTERGHRIYSEDLLAASTEPAAAAFWRKIALAGEVDERFKSHAWKACLG